jgi:acyl-homoserine lactone acylase PvdQ
VSKETVVARAEIIWDEWGVPHVYADNEESAAYACGWAQMRAHGELIARLYAQARGRAADVYDEGLLDSDRRVRTLGVPAANGDALSEEAGSTLPLTTRDVIAHAKR